MIKMYFEVDDWNEKELYLTRVSFLKGIIMLLLQPFVTTYYFNYKRVPKKDLVFTEVEQ